MGGIEIRKAKDMNIAFMAKLGWRLLTEQEALWAQVLKTCYMKKGMGIDNICPARNDSNAWK